MAKAVGDALSLDFIEDEPEPIQSMILCMEGIFTFRHSDQYDNDGIDIVHVYDMF